MRRAPAESRPLDRVVTAAGGLIGGGFFFWISGLRVLVPTEYGWVMQLDWRIHFLGWHFFRREPWSWPPGHIAGYFAIPDGTALAFTDSIPLVALLLKPVATLLPPTFQYLGSWLMLCFVLQGVLGVLLARLWTWSISLQLVSAALLVLMPTLLIRVGHPSLCAHWLLLWALWLYLRGARGSFQSSLSQAVLGLSAGLVHPYLAVMVMAILGALLIKDVVDFGEMSSRRARLGALTAFAAAAGATIAGWWASGLFTVSGADNLASEGLGRYSMNLLAPVTPSGWSTLLPDVPVATSGQPYEGFQYMGAGGLLLLTLSFLLAIRYARALPWRHLLPLLGVTALCALYALSPRITMGEEVLLDWSHRDLDRYAMFRATGRFFWPLAYTVVVSSFALLVSKLPFRVAISAALVVLAVQLVDLQEAHAERRTTSRSDYFHAHRLPLTARFWEVALPHYTRLTLLPPAQCGHPPLPFEWPAFLAGRHGLTINAGEVARYDQARLGAYCVALDDAVARGKVDDDTVYLVERSRLEQFRSRSVSPLACGDVDGVVVCVTERSSARWRDQTPLGPR